MIELLNLVNSNTMYSQNTEGYFIQYSWHAGTTIAASTTFFGFGCGQRPYVAVDELLIKCNFPNVVILCTSIFQSLPALSSMMADVIQGRI